MQTACPQCRNPGFAIAARNQLRCGRCNHIWEHTLAYPDVPGPVRLPTAPSANFRTGGGNRALIWIAAVVLVAMMGAGWFVFGAISDSHLDTSQADAPRPRSSSTATPKSTQAETPKPPPTRPKVKPAELLTSRFEGRNGDYRYWVLLLNNPHDTQIEPQRVSVRPANDEAVDRYSMSVGIPAKTHAWMLVVLEDTTEQPYSFEVKPIPHAYAHTMATVKKLPLKDLALDTPAANSYERPKVRGRVHNDTGGTVNRIFVQVIGLDDDRNPVAYAETYMSDSIAPDGQLDFTVWTGTYQIKVPARWEVQAFGVVKP